MTTEFATETVPTEKALDRLEELRAAGRAAVMVGGAEELDALREATGPTAKLSPADAEAAVAAFDWDAWSSARIAELTEDYEPEEAGVPADAHFAGAEFGEWNPEAVEPDDANDARDFFVFYPAERADVEIDLETGEVTLAEQDGEDDEEEEDFDLEPRESVTLVLTDAPQAHLTPAVIGFGGWNDVPAPAEVAGILKRWSETCGAEVVAISADVMEFSVARPPMTHEDALALAKEHYLFCPDRVWQGSDTLNQLAAEVFGARTWFFWWD